MMRRTRGHARAARDGGLGTSARRPGPAASTLDERRPRSLNLTAYAELLRSDVRAEKVAILTEVMGFTEAEDKAFWPIYREYERGDGEARRRARRADRRVRAGTTSTLTDAVAQTLGDDARSISRRGGRR